MHAATFNSNGRGDVIELLRARGADPRHETKSGSSPVKLPRMIGNDDVAPFYADVVDP